MSQYYFYDISDINTQHEPVYKHEEPVYKHEETLDKHKWKAILQNNWSVFFKSVQVTTYYYV